MKKSILFFATVLSLMFTACQKEGPAGPVGDPGPPGEPGIPSNMKITSKDFNIASGDWSILNDHGCMAEIAVPEISESVLKNGVVLIYHILNSSLRLTPYSNLNNGKLTDMINTQTSVGKITIFMGYTSPKKPPLPAQKYRAIIIPGAEVSGRIQSGNSSSYSIEQLRHMTYQEVSDALNIRQ